MTVKAERYFHINNGGVTFAVEDNGRGPEIVVKASHFGQETACTRLRIPQQSLAEMGRMFAEAATQTYSDHGHWDTCSPARDPKAPRVMGQFSSNTPPSYSVTDGKGGMLAEGLTTLSEAEEVVRKANAAAVGDVG